MKNTTWNLYWICIAYDFSLSQNWKKKFTKENSGTK